LYAQVVDERMLEIMGNLAVEHVAGRESERHYGSDVEWQDIGIFAEAQWTVLVGKCLGSFSKSVL
jgi:proteasome activator subunit 4